MIPNIPTGTVLFKINHLFAFTLMVSNIANKKNFIFTQLNGFKHRYDALTQFRHIVIEFHCDCYKTIRETI